MVRPRSRCSWERILCAVLLGAGLGPPAAARPLDLIPAPRELRVPPGGAQATPDSQAYRLTVEPRVITIEAATAQGRYYAVQTLRQILRICRDGRVPRVTIADRPALAWRGVSDDVSRGQVSTL